YRAEAVLAPTEESRASGLPSGLSGLAGIAGLNLGSGSSSAEALAMLRSRAFIEEFIEDNELLPVLFPEAWDSQAKQWRQEGEDAAYGIGRGVDFFINNVRTVSEE